MRTCSLGNRPGLGRGPWIALLLVTSTVLGCVDDGARAPTLGELVPVSGRVLVGGTPARGVEVQLHPLNRFGDADAPTPRGETDAEGRFRLRLGEDEEGAPTGQYTVTLVWPGGPGGSDRLGGAFADPEGSGLVAIIEQGTTELPPFDVDLPGRRGRSD